MKAIINIPKKSITEIWTESCFDESTGKVIEVDRRFEFCYIGHFEVMRFFDNAKSFLYGKKHNKLELQIIKQ